MVCERRFGLWGVDAVQPAGDFAPRLATYFWLDPKVGKSSSLLRSPLCFAKGFPALLEDRPRPELPTFASLTLVKHAGRARRVACLRHAGHSSALLGGADGEPPAANSQQPAADNRTARRAAGCSAVRYSGLPLCAGEERKNPRACADRHTTLLTRPACLSGESRRRTQRVLAGPGVLSTAANPLAQPRGERSRGLTFCLLLGQAKSRSAAGTKAEGFGEAKSRRAFTQRGTVGYAAQTRRALAQGANQG
jgi:hypothetical protein